MSGHLTRRAGLAAVALVVAGATLQGRPSPAASRAVTVEVREVAWATTDVVRIAQLADDVLVGTVEETSGHGSLDRIPTTTSRVRVLSRLKGSSGPTITATQLGGTDPSDGHLVLVRDDQLLQPGQTYLLALVRRQGARVVVPVGGDRLLPGAATSATPWADYRAVAALQAALSAQDEDVLQPARTRG